MLQGVRESLVWGFCKNSFAYGVWCGSELEWDEEVPRWWIGECLMFRRQWIGKHGGEAQGVACRMDLLSCANPGLDW